MRSSAFRPVEIYPLANSFTRSAGRGIHSITRAAIDEFHLAFAAFLEQQVGRHEVLRSPHAGFANAAGGDHLSDDRSRAGRVDITGAGVPFVIRTGKAVHENFMSYATHHDARHVGGTRILPSSSQR